MLIRLYIQNIALISRMDTEFFSGLNVITGETGAGKSIIVDSINLVLGGRADKELIKHGEHKARVEAMFDITNCPAVIPVLQDAGIDTDDMDNDGQVIISREISVSDSSSNVKSVCRINGSLVTVSALKAVSEQLIDIHGQHEHQSLLSAKRHVDFLDSYAQKDIAPIKDAVKTAYHKYKSVEKELNTGFASENERQRRADILAYQIAEIEAVSPLDGEDDELSAKRDLLVNSEQIISAFSLASQLLFGNDESTTPGALYAIKDAANAIESVSEFSEEYACMVQKLNDAYYSLEDVAHTVRSNCEDFSFDPKLLDEIETRLYAISGLKRKYGKTIAKVLEYLSDAKKELDALQNVDETREKLLRQREQYRKEYIDSSTLLSEVRRRAGEVFCSAVVKELKELGLTKAELAVKFERLPEEIPSSTGIDKIEFLLSTNPGEPKKPLVKVASGGEISRIMLALKTVLSGCEGVSTMIFDEIDIGISGNTATVVGEKMSRIATDKQVIAITHLPQIAVFADSHYLVEKTFIDDNTANTSLVLLDESTRYKEIARIMGGADSDLAEAHAKSMIESAKKSKKSK